MLISKFKFFSPESEGGIAPTTPVTPPVAEVSGHIEDAATGATEVAQATGEDGWQVVADELRGLRGDIDKLMKGSTAAATQAAAPATTPSEPPAPDVEVEVPKPPARKVRRGHRKVTRG